jgi:hypothetical protein
MTDVLALRVVRHPGVCGERIPSPHERCQAKFTPYLGAEIIRVNRTSIGQVRVLIYRCHGCNATWQGSETAA